MTAVMISRRYASTLSSVVDHLPQAVARFHDIVADRVRGSVLSSDLLILE